jgi:hypothetical protein
MVETTKFIYYVTSYTDVQLPSIAHIPYIEMVQTTKFTCTTDMSQRHPALRKT